MKEVQKLENSMEKAFKDLPSLSESAKETLAKALPWVALIAGLIQLIVAWGLYDMIRLADRLTYGILGVNGSAVSGMDRFSVYLSIVVLVADAAILLMAYKPLSERKRRGLDLLFLGSVINVVYAVVGLVTGVIAFSSFLLSLISSAVGFYLLIQVRAKFGGAESVKKAIVDKTEEVRSKVKSASKKK